jgi:hypothetical protein
LVTVQSKLPYLATYVNSVKNLNVFIKVCSQKISRYEGGGVMVKDLILQREDDKFKSSHLQCRPLSW